MIDQETDRDRYFHPHEAKEFGLVDEVLIKQSEAKKYDTASVAGVSPHVFADGTVGLTPRRSPRPRRTLMPQVPFVISRDGREPQYFDIYSRLLKDRIIFLQGEVDDDSANLIVAQMLYLQFEDPKADIHLYINSPGGSVTAGMGIYDTMQFVTCDVATYCIGQAASMGAMLLTAGAKGKRYALPNARIMIHQPLAGLRGTATEILIHAKEYLRMKKHLNEILVKHTGQTLEQIEKDTDRDNFMSAAEAKDYGLVDACWSTSRPGRHRGKMTRCPMTNDQ